MNSNILFTSTITDFLGMDHTGTHLNLLADNFYHASYDLLRQISQTMDTNNYAEWRSHMHTLKGVAGIAGAKNLHDLCDSIRKRNTDGFIDSRTHIMATLHDAINEYRDAVSQTLDAIPDKEIKNSQ